VHGVSASPISIPCADVTLAASVEVNCDLPNMCWAAQNVLEAVTMPRGVQIDIGNLLVAIEL